MSIVQTREQIPQIARGRAAAARRAGTPAQAGAPEAHAGITGRDVMRILRKRKWLIVICLVSISAAAFVTTLLWRMFAPAYTATAYLGVNPLGQNAFATAQMEFIEVRAGGLKAAHARMIGQESFLARAMQRSEVTTTGWFKEDPEYAVERLREILTVAPMRDAPLIMLEITKTAATDQERLDLAEIVNTIADTYVEHVAKMASQGRAENIRRLQTKRTELQDQLDRVQEQIRLRRLPEMALVQQRIGLNGRQLEVLGNIILELEMQRKQVEDAIRQVTEAEEKGPEALMAVMAVRMRVGEDPKLQRLRDREFALFSLLQDYLMQLGPEHRMVHATKASLDAVQRILAAETVGAARSQAQSYKEENNLLLEAIITQLESIRSQVADIETTLTDLQRNLRETRELHGREATLVDRTKTIDDTIVQLELLSQADKPVRVRASASQPKEDEISRPKWIVMMPLGGVIGLVLGLGLAFLLELTDTSIKGPADLARRVDLPVLGMIPHADDLEEDFERLPLAFLEHPNSPICEAHRQIRTCLLFSGPASQQRSLLISSPLPGDGRTTLAMNLAHSIAHSGRKVLVVDANFRQPAFNGLFPQCPEQGLSNVLVVQNDWRDLRLEVEPNLSVLGSGPLPPNPAELLGSEQMRKAIEEMSETYDQVLFDGAPCLVVADPVALSALVDGVILVARAGASTSGIIQRVRYMFQRVEAHVMGMVLNGVRVVAGGYLRKNYAAFYEYREAAQLPSK